MAAEVAGEEEVALDPSTALRLVAAAAWHTVREHWIQDFSRVLALLEAVEDAAPDLVHYRHLAKLRLGLQAEVIMNMLKEEETDGKIYSAIDAFFPEHEPAPHPKATAHDLKLVQVAQKNFRDLVLGLLSDQRQRETYVQKHLENDYGKTFQTVVEELFYDYLWQLESTLPKPRFQQLLKAAYIQDPRQSSPDPSILSRYLTDMGYQTADSPAHLSSPSRSRPLLPSEDDQQQAETSESGKQQPNPPRGRRKRSCQPCTQEQNSPGYHPSLQLPSNQEAGEPDDIVQDSSGEGENSLFQKGEYQCTHHDTLIPTFHDHLVDTRSQCDD
ncbi:TERF1-interacting nuclear factor 2 isoform X2 [Eublepharis macularius]|uniref:TERF1-interacting nuclear factor 2 isoform X2 n=1 Tax=Eublepharis macularius TaxID=481883 RepID=A0AA97K547_EUBMA|nr:TERF1-interacting nuclear factor 2 isoform X2 [Eublepharis macularius]